MTKQDNQELKSVSISDLAKETLIFSKVVAMIEGERPQSFILSYLSSKGYKCSKATLTNLKKKIKESHEQGVPLETLLDKRKKSSIADVDPNNISGYHPKSAKAMKGSQYSLNDNTIVTQDEYDEMQKNKPVQVQVKSKVTSPREVLEELMNKGFDTLKTVDFVDINTTLRAAETYAKLYGDMDGGLTTPAIQQYQILLNAMLNAMQEVLIKYVPQTKQQEAMEALETTRENYLKDMASTEEGKKLLKAFKSSSLDF